MDGVKAFDPSGYKSTLRGDWDAVAGGWARWWDTIEKGSRPVSEKLLDLARVMEGHRVLDVATGIGEPAVSAARRVGPSGRVTAVDLSPGMLNEARRRASALGIGTIEFIEMDGESLCLSDRGFDAVLCRWGLMFFPDPVKALIRMRELLKPGGRVAVAVWGPPHKVPAISLVMGVVKKELGLEGQAPQGPTPFSLADTGLVKRHFSDAGLSDVKVEGVTVTFELPSAEAYASYAGDVARPVLALLKDRPEEVKRRVWKAVEDAALAYGKGGGIRMENEAFCISGRA
jgi:SAM-dependent methyltransferase